MDLEENQLTLNIPKNTIKIYFGEELNGVQVEFTENVSFIKRLKWWLFSKAFPLRYEWINQENGSE